MLRTKFHTEGIEGLKIELCKIKFKFVAENITENVWPALDI